MMSRLSVLLSAAVLVVAGAAAAVVNAAPAAAHAVNPADFQQIELARGVPEMGEPMSLAVLPDRSVLHTARNGTLRRTTAAGATSVIGTLQVYSHDEEGLQGVAVDPGFASNRFIYLYYAPPLSTPAGDAPATGTDFSAWNGVNRLARFTLNADFTLNLGSQVTVLDVPATRGICCHVGGDIDFDAAGNLYLSTGDDTNPFESNGYSPIDERTNRNPAYAPGTAGTRPEIYAMGFRNPFRLSVDKPTGAVYLGEYGPDAGAASATRGPGGQVEFNRITSPGNYGWPYCTGSNTTGETVFPRPLRPAGGRGRAPPPAVDFTFPSGPSGARFNCAAPTNNSPRNTGMTNLPAARPAWIKFPAALDGHYFAAEFGQINEFPWRGTQIIDTAFGPDGTLYVLDYGTGSFGGDANSALYRIEYNPAGNQAPVARASANRTSGIAPLAVNFSSAGSSHPEGGALTYSWNFGDGGTSTAANPSHTYTSNGQRTASLTVTDPGGRSATASVVITVGNTAPTVTLTTPINGTLFSFGDTIPYTITVSDPEDGTIYCARVKLTYVLGHDSHGHPITSRTGCSGSLTIPVDGEHDAAANLFAVLDAEYTDLGANGQPALTTHAQNTLQPRHRQAEHRTTQSGTGLFSKPTAEGGQTVGDIQNGDWIAFQPYAPAGANRFTARVSSAGAGGTLAVRTGSPTGTVLGTVTVPVTGSWETFTEVSTALSGVPGGTTTQYLTFAGGAGALFDVDSFTFNKPAGGGTGAITGVGGKCVDVSNAGTADGTKIQLWTCNGTGAQNWTAGANGALVNPQSNKCLDATGGSTADGTQLIIFSCSGAANQRWETRSAVTAAATATTERARAEGIARRVAERQVDPALRGS